MSYDGNPKELYLWAPRELAARAPGIPGGMLAGLVRARDGYVRPGGTGVPWTGRAPRL